MCLMSIKLGSHVFILKDTTNSTFRSNILEKNYYKKYEENGITLFETKGILKKNIAT